jgi:hypothetical protein
MNSVMARDTASQVIVEFIPVGSYVKVSAIDSKTGPKYRLLVTPSRGTKLLSVLQFESFSTF